MFWALLSHLLKYLGLLPARASEQGNVIGSVSVYVYIIGERAKRARHSQVCSIENRGYIYYVYIVRAMLFL